MQHLSLSEGGVRREGGGEATGGEQGAQPGVAGQEKCSVTGLAWLEVPGRAAKQLLEVTQGATLLPHPSCQGNISLEQETVCTVLRPSH